MIIASTAEKITYSPKSQIKSGFANDQSSEAFILHSPRAQNNNEPSAIGQLVTTLVSSKSSELNSSDSLGNSKHQAIGQLIGGGSPTKSKNNLGKDNYSKNNQGLINNDFSDSSESENDYINRSAKNNKFNNTGKEM